MIKLIPLVPENDLF
jgi:serine/threonine-protein phosphatase 2A regulatory subunit A